MKRSGKIKTAGFSIVELLTVMSIIVVLIGLLVPGLAKVRRYAKDVQQKVQFRGIANGLEMYSAEMEGYPDSTEKPLNAASNVTVGAQHLAEALAGRDLQGFDPASSGNAAQDLRADVYPISGTANFAKSVERRKGPYLDVDSGNVDLYEINELYKNPLSNGVYSPPKNNITAMPAPVLTDVFRNFRVEKTLSDGSTRFVKTGSPILYFKAKPGIKVMCGPLDTSVKPDDSVYNIYDNLELIKYGPVEILTGQNRHRFDDAFTEGSDDGIDIFYRTIQNKRITNRDWPYNADSYILISAGWDGIFGTNDDVVNFGD